MYFLRLLRALYQRYFLYFVISADLVRFRRLARFCQACLPVANAARREIWQHTWVTPPCILHCTLPSKQVQSDAGA